MARRELAGDLALRAIYMSVAYGGEAGRLLAEYARKLLEKTNTRKPYEYRLIYCRKCKEYSPVGISRNVRLRKGSLVFHCAICGATYRMPYRGTQRIRGIPAHDARKAYYAPS
ncbi:hypothetical protein [Conexivisphaera calida]|uniref:Uncharacterized protein n=1 Tax=Conexivisphaera calida TaxID=1874277 RepID=A0A4P2VHV1_9ARCH|nr:hypothetical protein [Conexivisphaera calida]BBE42973.1 hypothetical protein NAS2_1596 [Conexivisphaera calida]